MHPTKKSTAKLLLASVLLVTIMAILGISLASAAPDYPYTGNYTRIRKPGFPVEIKEDQIQPGEVWTYKVPLERDRRYHIYLIGEWVDLEDHITDYDIFLYKKSGNKEIFISIICLNSAFRVCRFFF